MFLQSPAPARRGFTSHNRTRSVGSSRLTPDGRPLGVPPASSHDTLLVAPESSVLGLSTTADSDPTVPEAAGELQPLDVLFLDDDASTRDLMKLAIGRLGHRVLCSGSVQEAINLLKTFVFDVMICDLTLPDGNGLDVARHVPVGHPICKIVLSGHGEMTDVARSLAAGFDAHLVKPVDMAMLQRAIWKATGRCL